MLHVRLPAARGQHVAVYDAVSTLLRDMERRFWTFLNPPGWAPAPNNLKRRAARRAIDAFVLEIVTRRRRSPEAHEDLLQILIDAYGNADGGNVSHAELGSDRGTVRVVRTRLIPSLADHDPSRSRRRSVGPMAG